MNDKISIIVPVYNAEKTLVKCIESLVSQLYTNIEIILVNDGSKDSSLDICRKYSEMDERIVVIDKSNGGVSTARNTGLDNATGDFVMFCDSDDIVSCSWCQVMIDEYEANVLTMCKFIEVDSNSINRNDCVKKEYKAEYFSRAQFIYYREIGIGLPTTKIFNNNIIKDNGLRFPLNISLGEDLIFVSNYLSCISGDIKYIDCELYYYLQYNNVSLSHSIPSFEQTKILFNLISKVFYDMKITDSRSIIERDNMIIRDYEKQFTIIKSDKNMTFRDKHKIIKEAMRDFVYTSIVNNKNIKISTNPLYNYALKSKNALLFLLV